MTITRWLARARPALRLTSWTDKMLVVGLLCVAASAVAIVTQLGHPAVQAVSLPPDSLAQPFAGLPGATESPASPPAATSTATAAPATPTPAPQCPAPVTRLPGAPSQWPAVIVIKKLGIDAQIEQAVLDRHGQMQVPRNPCDVAWFKPGPVPGAAGDAVIDGHLDWTSGPSVFWNLHELRRGDEIDILQAGGRELRFIVSRLRTVPHSTLQTGLFSRTGPPMLSLYTCAGVWEPWVQTYSERLIIDATLVR